MFSRRNTNSMVRRSTVAAISFAAFAVLATACTDSQSIASETQGSGVDSSTTSISPTTTFAPVDSRAEGSLGTAVETTVATTVPAPAPTPAPAPETTAATAPPACPDDTAPSGSAVAVQALVGDWNGDGAVDDAVSWAEETGGGVEWFVRTELNGGPSSTVALGDLGVGFAEVLDAVDADFSLGLPPGSNRDELLAIVGSNAAGYNLGVFGVADGGCLFRFDDGAGSPFELPVHAAVAVMSGMMCDGGAGSQFMVRLEAQTMDDMTWQIWNTKIVRTGATSLGDGVSIPGELLADDAALQRYGNAECFGEPYFGEAADF